MRIALISSGRAHLLDLAREFHELGHEVQFYSYVPRFRALQFGLPSKCHRALLPYVAPLVAAIRKAPEGFSDILSPILQLTLDRLVATVLRPCDVLVGMSGLCVLAARRAREAFGAKVFLERGSRHILSQKEILESIPGTRRPAVPSFDVKRELWGYDFADVISVPSHHVERSFRERGTQSSKLFRNPYGVDLEMFPPTEKPEVKHPTVIFAGTWSLRKGCDVLWEACRSAQSWKLLHVGAIGDAPVPQSPLFSHRDVVPQPQLADIYREAHVFVHPSREEGLSLVQAQALACGLPLVCTDRTGGEDLREVLCEPEWITVVPHGDVVALSRGIGQALAKAAEQTGLRDILGLARDKLSWRAYGKRYSEELLKRCSS